MRRELWLLPLVLWGGLQAGAAPAPGLTIAAKSVTMPATGGTSIPVTVTSTNGYAGTVALSCNEVEIPAGARVPYCGGGPAEAFPVTADGSVSAQIALTPYGDPIPAGVVLLAGLGLRRRRRAVVSAALLGLALAAGCGGGDHA